MYTDKNSKESFIKKLQLCMKNYDYKDEQKDVKGKVSLVRNLRFIVWSTDFVHSVNYLSYMTHTHID